MLQLVAIPLRKLSVVLVLLCGTGQTLAQLNAAQNLVLIMENGQALLQSGQYFAAETAFYEAFQLSRMHSGLYSTDQIPILEAILASAVLQGKWEPFLRRAQYLERTHLLLHRNHPDELVAGLRRVSHWHLAAAAAMDEQASVWHLIKSRNLLWQAVSRIEAQGGRDDPRLPPLLYEITLNHFYLAQTTRRRGQTSYELRTDSPAFFSGWSEQSNANLRRSYDVGLELLGRIREIYAAHPVTGRESAALALMALADWQLLFGRGSEARALYRQGYEELLNAGFTSLQLDDFFSSVITLPIAQLHATLAEAQEFNTRTEGNLQAWSHVIPGVPVPSGYPFALLSDTRAFRRFVPVQFAAGESDAGIDERVSRPEEFSYRITDVRIETQETVTAEDEQEVINSFALVQLRPVLKAGEVSNLTDGKFIYELAPLR